MNNKGFMMAEVVVVSAIILVVLSSLYVSYNKILTIYNERVDYYDVKTLYNLADIRDSQLTGKTVSVSTPIINTEYNKVYYIDKNDLSSLNVQNKTFKDYVEFLSTSLNLDDIKENELLIMERCITKDNCKYGYLEVA